MVILIRNVKSLLVLTIFLWISPPQRITLDVLLLRSISSLHLPLVCQKEPHWMRMVTHFVAAYSTVMQKETLSLLWKMMRLSDPEKPQLVVMLFTVLFCLRKSLIQVITARRTSLRLPLLLLRIMSTVWKIRLSLILSQRRIYSVPPVLLTLITSPSTPVRRPDRPLVLRTTLKKLSPQRRPLPLLVMTTWQP